MLERKSSKNIFRQISVILTSIEGVLLLCLALYLIYRGLTSEVVEGDALIAEVTFLLLGGLGLLAAARSFKTGKKYGRAPTILANLIALGVSNYMREGEKIELAAPLALVALLTIVSILMTPVHENIKEK